MEEVGRREGWYCRVGQASFRDGGRVKHPLDVDTSLNLHVGLVAPPCSLPQFPSLWEGNSC